MEMCYDGALVMPSNCVLVNEDEMMYIDGGTRYYSLTGLFSLIIGTGTGAVSVYKSVKTLAKIGAEAVKKALSATCRGIVGYLSLVWYASQIATACMYLKKYGTYSVNTYSIWDYGIANYVSR